MNYVYLLLFCARLFSGHDMHSSTNVAPSSNQKVEPGVPSFSSPDPRVFFRAKGTFPTWSLSISELQIAFQSEDIRHPFFNAPYVEPVKVADANIRKYTVHTETGTMEVELAQMLCMNEGSKERFPYSVTVRLKTGVDTDFTSFT